MEEEDESEDLAAELLSGIARQLLPAAANTPTVLPTAADDFANNNNDQHSVENIMIIIMVTPGLN